MFGLIDALEKINLRPETKTKIKKTRENFAKTLKDEAEREAREEAADAKLAAKRRAEEERVARLSAAEQQKVILLVYTPLAPSAHLYHPFTSSWTGIASEVCARHRERLSKNSMECPYII
jgi:ATPase subunit of ABC transporter with duplicated ATPase domains